MLPGVVEEEGGGLKIKKKERKKGESPGKVTLRAGGATRSPSVPPSVRPSVCPALHPSHCLFHPLSVPPSICPTLYSTLCPSIHPSYPLSIYPSIPPSVHPSIPPSHPPSAPASILLSIHPTLRLSHPRSVHPSIPQQPAGVQLPPVSPRFSPGCAQAAGSSVSVCSLAGLGAPLLPPMPTTASPMAPPAAGGLNRRRGL